MTTAADDPAVEAAFEAYLAGRPVPEEAAGLTAFAEAVRSTATRPGRPNAALAELLATGLLTDQSSPSARTATSDDRPRASRVRIRRRPMFLPALLAKIASAGVVAQAAAGAGIVLVAFTGAGAAGVLPDPLQHGFATVADTMGIQVSDPRESGTNESATSKTAADDTDTPTSASPADLTGTTDETGSDDTATSTDGATTSPPSTTTGDPALTEEEWAANGPAAGQPFGEWVREGARNGWADGATISHWAHLKHVPWPEGTTAPATTTAPPSRESSDDDTSATEVESGQTSGDRTPGRSGTSGGHGNGEGHGNAGRGGSGQGDD